MISISEQLDSAPWGATDRIVEVVCAECGCRFQSPLFHFGRGCDAPAKICDACGDTLAAGEKPAERVTPEQRREALARQLIPPKFRHWQESLYPKASLPFFRRVLAWEPESARGLILLGESGAGKTWALFCHLHGQIHRDVRVAVLEAIHFSRAIQGWYGGHGDTYAGNAAIDRYCRAEVLYIDDLGKETGTPRVQSELLGILDYRDKARLPTLLTGNLAGADLIARSASEDVASACVRRLRDNCETLVFPAPPSPETR